MHEPSAQPGGPQIFDAMDAHETGHIDHDELQDVLDRLRKEGGDGGLVPRGPTTCESEDRFSSKCNCIYATFLTSVTVFMRRF